MWCMGYFYFFFYSLWLYVFYVLHSLRNKTIIYSISTFVVNNMSVFLPVSHNRYCTKRLNVGSRKQRRTIVQDLQFSDTKDLDAIRMRLPSTPTVNWMSHIKMPSDSCCMNLYGAVRHNVLGPIISLRLLTILVNWCIFCGDPWMLRSMFLSILHYVLM